jgi:alanine racemase
VRGDPISSRPDEGEDVTGVRTVSRIAPRNATRVEVDLDAITANLRDVKVHVGRTIGVLAILKGDAYGHGLVPVALALAAEAALSGIVVTSVADGLDLRQRHVAGPILVMAPTFEDAHDAMLAADLVPVVTAIDDFLAFARATRRLGTSVSVHVKIDTGMGRLGIRESVLDELLSVARQNPQVRVSGVCTHLASADSDSASSVQRQLGAFEQALQRLRIAGHAPTIVHAANTAATFRRPRSYFSHVRTGIALFGGDDASVRLRPAMRFVTRIAQLRSLAPGDAVSYGERWRARRPTRVATLPVGYGLGYPRRLFAGGTVLVGGRRCPIIGVICMEMMMVDVTDLGGDVSPGDEVVLIGAQGDDEISARDLACSLDTIVEDVFCGISRGVAREYMRHASCGERSPLKRTCR